jgi:hypothetical protein
MSLRKGQCKKVRGKKGIKLCRLKSGKVRFKAA